VADDDAPAISYKALARGVDVVTADGTRIGAVRDVLDNVRENIFDGIVVDAADGRRLFVDAPEVSRITELEVTLTIDAAQAVDLPEYEKGAPVFHANPRSGRLGRFFGGGWRRR
jgi:sporulation protein YlmC with PRC-barrel domain